MLLVVGLGNPGRQYSANRHNVGFMVVDELANACNSGDFRSKFNGEVAKGELGGEEFILLKPQTFMNESGRSVQAAMAFFKPAVDRVLVIHDELDLPFGTIRLKVGGGHAGHNGLRSIMACIGSGEFGRVRFGIGRPQADFRGEVADYVLANFDAMERAELPLLLKKSGSTVLEVATRGVRAAMNVHNVRPKSDKKNSKDPEASKSVSAPSKGSEEATDSPSEKRLPS